MEATPWDRPVFLPRGQRLVRHQVPEPLPDFQKLIEMQESKIALALGVPDSLLFNKNTQYRGDAELFQWTFNKSIIEMQTHFKLFLKQIYSEVYGERLTELAVKKTQRKGGSKIETVQVEVSFNSMPLINVDNISKLRDRGWLDEDDARRFALASYGISQDNVAAVVEKRSKLSAPETVVKERTLDTTTEQVNDE